MNFDAPTKLELLVWTLLLLITFALPFCAGFVLRGML